MYPLLSLSQISIDPELVRQLPRRLAYYHLALPIAQDEDNITVAMAHPDNPTVVAVLGTALGTAITPVRSHAADIRRALDDVWQKQGDVGESGLIYWADSEARQEAVRDYAHTVALPLAVSVHDETIPPGLESFLTRARELRPMLVVCEVADPKTLADLFTVLQTSMLLLRGSSPPPKNILHVLRGHTPDKRALDWIIPIAHHYAAQITLLAAAPLLEARQGNPLLSDFASLILAEHPAQVVEHGQILASLNLRGRIKIAEGLLEDVISTELARVPYDLVAIATEAYGEFVHRALQRIPDNQSAFLIVKP